MRKVVLAEFSRKAKVVTRTIDKQTARFVGLFCRDASDNVPAHPVGCDNFVDGGYNGKAKCRLFRKTLVEVDTSQMPVVGFYTKRCEKCITTFGM